MGNSKKMIAIPINFTVLHKVEEYCNINIGPRKYYLHNQHGGERWAIKYNTDRPSWTLECDEKHAVIITLKYCV